MFRLRLFNLALACAISAAMFCNVAAAQAPAGHPGTQGEPEPDRTAPSPEVPRGTIEALIVDANNQPMPGVPVRLGIMFRKVAEGDSRSEKFATTDAQGKARFSELSSATEYSYRVTVPSGTATFATTPFALSADMGHTALLHVYPVSADMNQVLVGSRGMMYIQTRDDVYQFEVLFRVFNIGRVAWVPTNTSVRLPAGFKAFKAGESMNDTRFEAKDDRVFLKGTFGPGQHDVSFRYQVTRSGEENMSFNAGLLPRTADVQIIAEASPTMQLEVDGFDPPQVGTNQQGQRVLISRKQFRREEAASEIRIALSGLPSAGNGRWVAVAIAVAFAGAGFVSARGGLTKPAKKSKRGSGEDIKAAREILLEELVAVEQAKQRGDLGPRAYSQAHQTLVDALTRLHVV
jgi:hypothetical protein